MLLLVTLQSCLNDHDAAPQPWIAVGTLHALSGNDYYFELDGGETLYPGDTLDIHHYTVTDGQRAFVYFFPMDKQVEGYDVNAKLLRIEDILTKDVQVMTDENMAEIGDDRINLIDAAMNSDYLTIRFQFLAGSDPDAGHLISLVKNETTTAPAADEQALTLEFRHNANGDKGQRLYNGIVSYRLRNIQDALEGKDKLKLVFSSIYEGNKTYTLTLKQPR
jgi:hypothetical protein